MRTTMLRWTAVAASVTLIVMTSFYFFGNNEKTAITASVEPTREEYTNYLLDELQDEELYAFVSENQPVNSDTTDVLVDYLIDESSDFELEEY